MKKNIMVCLFLIITAILLACFNYQEKTITTNYNPKFSITLEASTVTPHTKIKNKKDKEKGNATYNLQDFDNDDDGNWYMTRQSRGKCVLSGGKGCSTALRWVYVYKYNSTNECNELKNCHIIKESEMLFKNSGHGTVFNIINIGGKTKVLIGQGTKNRTWKDKKGSLTYIGASSAVSLFDISIFSNKKTIDATSADKRYENKDVGVYDIGVNESGKYISVRNKDKVRVYQYNETKNHGISSEFRKTYSIDTSKGIQGHDVNSYANIFVLENPDDETKFCGRIVKYSDNNKKEKIIDISLEKLKDAINSKIKNTVKKIDTCEAEGIKNINGKQYFGIKLKINGANDVYSMIFKYAD